MNNPLYRLGLSSTVFLTGLAVLIVEIAATRILAPYFGNSIFTFSSVIGIILAALSLGYYLGGRLADRRPSNFLFYGVIAAGGISVLLLQLLNLLLLPRIAYQLSMIHGPLAVSSLLFLLPALLLGMLSPFAIKLLHEDDPATGVGSVSGLVFFWSTLGSIAGSLGAGFLLIPRWGVGHIVIGTGVGLLLLGCAGMAAAARARRQLAAAAAVLLLGCAPALLAYRLAAPAEKSLVYRRDGLYERIAVQDTRLQNRPARLLLQDRNPNSGIYLDDGSLAFDYTRYFELYRLYSPRVRRALAIGGGAYSVPQALLQQLPEAEIDVAEIEPLLLPVAREYFGFADSPRLHNHVLDGRRFLHDTPYRYELIFSDVYHNFAATPPQFSSREFYELAAARLSENGVLIVNHYGSLDPSTRPLILSLLRTLRSVFPQVYVYAVKDPGSLELQNFIFVAQLRPERVDPGLAAGIAFTYPELKRIAALEYRPAAALVDAAMLLTDDYAPVEYYAAQVVRQYDALLQSRRKGS
ncbi:MAG TPA: fused MFS/spermidine synthase [Gammaproteobacteria bacterium]|nr:fused MFS/spermidine synthase [Gammaproteobacteria bacterium]